MTDQVDNQGVATTAATTTTAATQSDLLAGKAAETIVTTGKEETKSTTNFIDTLEEDLRKEKSLQTFKDPSGVARSYVELSKKFGKRITDLTADEIKAIDKKFGAPDKVEDYGIQIPKELADSDPILANIASDFFKVGLPKDKATALTAAVVEKMQQALKMEETEAKLKVESNVKQLKTEFGSAFNERIDLANKALIKFGGEAAVKVIKEAGLSSDPSLIKMLSEVGKLLAEDKGPGEKEPRQFGMTPDEADKELQKLMSDPAFVARLRNINHPGHEDATKQRENLYRLKSGRK
jgi:hypothetical protein